MTETDGNSCAVSVPRPTVKPSAALARQIRRNRADMRALARNAPPHIRSRAKIALKGLAELERNPLDTPLAVQVALNIRGAIEAAQGR